MSESQHPGRAALWMLGSVLSFSAMAVAGRSVAATHDTFELLMTRSAIGFALVLTFALTTGRSHQITALRLSGHALRNVVHFIGQNLWFWALTQITLAQLFAIEFTSPLWVILLAPAFLGERLTALRLTAAALGFAGVLIVARPDVAGLNLGLMAAAGAAISFASVSILTKRLTRGVPVLGILFWLTAMQFVLGLACAGIDGQITWPTAQTLPWLALIGGAGVLAHLCLTTALSLAPAGFVVTIDFLRLPLIAAVGALWYGERLDPLVLLGGAVILAAVWLNLRSARQG
jgi:drug/metabolite transporter (DMT)-like permease